MALVQPIATVTRWDEHTESYVTVRRGQAWNDSDEFVQRHPDLFEQPVEQATATPGEKRSTRRPAS